MVLAVFNDSWTNPPLVPFFNFENIRVAEFIPRVEIVLNVNLAFIFMM